ncbi:hypothetical protein P3X46_032746 [Hevea brasiliensis]|uniref:Uncharacterized protein n=1 Tax=Hevea brasiliensis TaxID=3981 RepID=A0ABQ9KE92_HEVBR|nr:hypothetical protein P3X46_032746 [Hevea brasiliensis]
MGLMGLKNPHQALKQSISIESEASENAKPDDLTRMPRTKVANDSAWLAPSDRASLLGSEVVVLDLLDQMA